MALVLDAPVAPVGTVAAAKASAPGLEAGFGAVLEAPAAPKQHLSLPLYE